MKKLLICLLIVACPAVAEESYVEPLLIGAATVAVIRTPYLNNKCNDEPCNTISHVALGAASGAYIKYKYGWKAAVLSGLVIGVGKELADQNFDTKDALATIAGSLLSLTVEF